MPLSPIYQAVLDGNAPAARAGVAAALAAGLSAEAILNNACIPAMTEVGRLFEDGEKFVPEMLISARAMSAATELLKPILAAEGVAQVGSVVIGTVAGDLHDIGKNLVGMMLEGAGFVVIDLGVDVPPQRFVEAVRSHRPDILAMSALLTTTTRAMLNTIAALHEAKMRDQVKVMVGGAPITQAFADEVGADGFSADAGAAVRKAKELLAR
ncbi:MAG: corrinoid protein [Caldilineales bacterium]|nr:corrinoid protein [Caldilineales bacterium]